jgi:hypothetical protein
MYIAPPCRPITAAAPLPRLSRQGHVVSAYRLPQRAGASIVALADVEHHQEARAVRGAEVLLHATR